MAQQDIRNVIIRVDDKPTKGNIVGYNGYARAGELVIDPTTMPPTIWVGDKNGNLNMVGGSNGSGGSYISNGTSYVTTSASNVLIGTDGNTKITVTNAGTTFSGTTNLGSNSSILVSGGIAGQTLISDGTNALVWGYPSASSVSNGSSNVNIPINSGNVNISVGGTANVLVVSTDGIDVNGNIAASGDVIGNNLVASGNVNTNNLNVSGTSNLGPVSNIFISGGSVGQMLITDGFGNLSWSSQTSISQIDRLEWIATSAGFNTTYNNAMLSFYPSKNNITLLKNGVSLSLSDYDLSGSTLQINEWVNIGDEIAVTAGISLI